MIYRVLILIALVFVACNSVFRVKDRLDETPRLVEEVHESPDQLSPGDTLHVCPVVHEEDVIPDHLDVTD